MSGGTRTPPASAGTGKLKTLSSFVTASLLQMAAGTVLVLARQGVIWRSRDLPSRAFAWFSAFGPKAGCRAAKPTAPRSTRHLGTVSLWAGTYGFHSRLHEAGVSNAPDGDINGLLQVAVSDRDKRRMSVSASDPETDYKWV